MVKKFKRKTELDENDIEKKEKEQAADSFEEKRRLLFRSKKIRKITTAVCMIIPFIVLTVFFSSIVLIRTVPTNSMASTIQENDHILINTNAYALADVKKGDVIVFTEDNINVVKRVIGTGGDKVEIVDGHIYLNGKELTEPYLENGTITEGNTSIELKQDEVFVLGDNRENSIDSRDIGAVKVSNIKGQTFFSFGLKDKFHFQFL